MYLKRNKKRAEEFIHFPNQNTDSNSAQKIQTVNSDFVNQRNITRVHQQNSKIVRIIKAVGIETSFSRVLFLHYFIFWGAKSTEKQGSRWVTATDAPRRSAGEIMFAIKGSLFNFSRSDRFITTTTTTKAYTEVFVDVGEGFALLIENFRWEKRRKSDSDTMQGWLQMTVQCQLLLTRVITMYKCWMSFFCVKNLIHCYTELLIHVKYTLITLTSKKSRLLS